MDRFPENVTQIDGRGSTDAELERLLAEALTPPPPPVGLSDRVAAATSSYLPRPAAGWLTPRVHALAASVVLAMGLGLLATLMTLQQPRGVSSTTVAETGQQLNALAAAMEQDPIAPLDREIEMLAMEVELADDPSFWADSGPGPMVEADPLWPAGPLTEEMSLLF